MINKYLIEKNLFVFLLYMLLGDVFNIVFLIYYVDVKQILLKLDEVLLCIEDISICEVKYNLDVEMKKVICD